MAAEYQGGPGFVHGGIIATLLDEVMGKVSRFRNVRTVTAELHVEYLRPVPVDEDIVVEGWEAGAKRDAICFTSARSAALPAQCWRAARDDSLRSTRLVIIGNALVDQSGKRLKSE